MKELSPAAGNTNQEYSIESITEGILSMDFPSSTDIEINHLAIGMMEAREAEMNFDTGDNLCPDSLQADAASQIGARLSYLVQRQERIQHRKERIQQVRKKLADLFGSPPIGPKTA